jgi:hypothetical protein
MAPTGAVDTATATATAAATAATVTIATVDVATVTVVTALIAATATATATEIIVSLTTVPVSARITTTATIHGWQRQCGVYDRIGYLCHADFILTVCFLFQNRSAFTAGVGVALDHSVIPEANIFCHLRIINLSTHTHAHIRVGAHGAQ